MYAIILFAHGSRDPLWHQPIQAVAQRIQARDAKVLVACAYLELTQPDLPQAAQQLIDQGATELCIVPMFLGVGKHAREDLPVLVEALRRAHPAVEINCQSAVGEQAALLDLLADLALSHKKAPR
jgi:sirohydrochlorin cobaltochelatase